MKTTALQKAASTRSTSLKLDPDIKERIQKLADRQKRSSHGLMVDAIREYVVKEEKREQLRRDALMAWDEYQENGLHVSGDEVIAWLKTWGEEDEQDAPTCHK